MLKHSVERMAMAATGETIRLKDLSLPPVAVTRKGTQAPLAVLSDTPIDLPSVIAIWEREMIEQAIARFQRNRSAAARHLGYEEATFRKKCRTYFGNRR